MEKRYYFRGLGLGIIVTAVIMGIALSGGSKKREMTDDEVIARAKELGMIEDSRLLEPSKEEGTATNGQEGKKMEAPVKKDVAAAADKEPAKEKQEATDQAEKKPVVGTPESAEKNEVADANESEEPAGQTQEPADSVQEKPQTDTNEMTKQDEDVLKPETGRTVSVTVSSGDGSYTVARKLAEAGVVSSADSYDDFLCASGYDKKLRPGTFQIPVGASEEQIARIVTRQE